MMKINRQIQLLAVCTFLSLASISQPTITSFTPQSGPAGSTVTINGTNFDPTAQNNIVYFGGVRATVQNSTGNTLSVVVPVSATHEAISVTTNGLTAFTTRPFTLTFSGGGMGFKHNSFDISTAATLPNGFPRSVAIADLDSDGWLDFVVTNLTGNSVSILRNQALQPTSFGNKIDYPTGSIPRELCVVDLDGDGKKDIVVSNANSHSVSVYRNTSSVGSLSFAPKVDFATGLNPNEVNAGDIDQDGRPDIVVANQDENSVSFLRNLSAVGNLSFASKIDFPTGPGSAPVGVHIADLDNDSKPDIISGHMNDSMISIHRNISVAGNISLESGINFFSGHSPRRVVASDLDSDGYLDLAVTNWNSGNKISIFKNQSNPGTISFQNAVPIVTNIFPYNITITDLNGNNKPELIVSCSSPGLVSVLDNISSTGSIMFDGKRDYSLSISTNDVSAGDFDRDGKPDILTPNFDNSVNPPILVLTNIVNEVQEITSINPASGPIGSTVNITGINFDPVPANNIVKFGRIKTTVISASTTSLTVKVPVGATFHPITVTTHGRIAASLEPFRVSFSNQLTIDSNSFAPRQNFYWISPTSFIDGPWGLESIDVNDDGKIDLVAKDGRLSPFNSVLRNQSVNGSIAFGNPSLYSHYGKNSLNVFDFDGDGLDDIGYTADKPDASGGAYIALNQGALASIHFSSSTGWSFPAPGTTLTSWGSTAADFDQDGRIDFAVVFNGNHQISIARNTTAAFGNANFTLTSIFPSNYIAQSIASGDLDGDLKPDLVVSDDFGGRLFVYTNTTDAYLVSFSSPIELVYQLAGNDRIRELKISDIDQDGKNDIVSLVDSRLYIRRNTTVQGQLSFADPVLIATIPQNRGLAIGDLNGDQKPELGVVGVFIPSFKTYIQLFQNNSTPGSLSFSSAIFLPSNFHVDGIVFADCNNDGLTDIATTNVYDDEATTVSIYKNLLGARTELCSGGSQTVTSYIVGTSYQWQIDSGNGFSNLSDDQTFNGANSATLNIVGINNSAYGYKFRCIVDGIVGPVHWLKFINTWTGASSNAWENIANWSCGVLPDANTDVTISSGNVVISSNVTIRSLTVTPGATVTVQPGFTLTITH